jgi:hypothetical protein
MGHHSDQGERYKKWRMSRVVVIRGSERRWAPSAAARAAGFYAAALLLEGSG